ncbi:hypothetical protein J8C01_00935 [Chloracidobacterium sp. D]|uniref:hypothetical protein n=1 Tax=Chloracidobacterium sp. D TaxID=2821536 RepID=UPI001B8BD3EF|nr:hypothetical protein [Chloracidobacterium sp. D]QUV81937.1 hypothetical protein J8C01_00935 [Chloracidobacterium sp. D]
MSTSRLRWMGVVWVLALALALTVGVGAQDAGLQDAGRTGEGRQGTIVNSRTGYAQLLGRHKLQLQWISWFEPKKSGDLTVTDRQGLLVIQGAQRDPRTGDFVEVDGIVTRVEDRTFDFRGRIVTRVSHINGGEPCLREGDMTFAIKGKRRFWRLQQMDNPCDGVTDYVDIFLR